MKAINKFFYALLALATVGMVGCQDAETYEPGAPELDGCYDVYFPDAETLETLGMTQGPTGDVELEPTVKTEFTYTAFRNNTEGEITVPVVVSTNTEGKFAVSAIQFADGEDVAEFKVTLLESEVGVTYDLALAIEDPQYVKQYESTNSNSLSVSITRVKWNNVGMCSYTDNIVTGWYSFTFSGEWAGQTHPTYDVQVQVRADSIDEAAFQAALAGTGSDAGLAGIYRLVNPYRVGPWGDPSDPSLTAVPNYIIINAEEVDKVYIPFQALGMDHIIADMTVMSEAYYQNTYASEPEDIPGMWGVIKGGTLRFEPDMLCGSPGGQYAGKIYGTNGDGAFALVLAPSLGSYELAMPNAEADGDFAFESVKLPQGALFYSESQKLVSEVSLEKGKPTVNTDDADRAFVQQYGYLYRLPNLYAEGYPIYFGVTLDGKVSVHPSYTEQATGLVQNGYDVYMAIDAASSTFDVETGLLNLVAEFYTYQGDYTISYGVYNEAVSVEAPEFPFAPAVDLKSDFTYSPLFTDTFTSSFQASEWEATLEKGTSAAAGAEAFAAAYGTAYRIPNAYANGYDIYFAGDAEGKVVLPTGYELQATGVSIYGQQAYLQIVSGTVASNGVSFSAKICNAEGKAIMPTTCKESLETYVWVDAATGSWYCNALKNPLTGLTLQNAEGTNLYRVVNFFTDVTGVEDKHFVFSWNKTTNRCEVQGMQDTGLPVSALGVSAPGNIHFADEKTTWNFLGYPDTWESLEAENGVSVQPYFDPAKNAFFFRVSYFLPEIVSMLTFTGSDGNKTYFVDEVFALDSAVTTPEWENVATGTFTHALDFLLKPENCPYPETGLTLQRYGQTDKYKIVGVVAGSFDIEFTYNEASGLVTVPANKTGFQYKESDGSMTDIYYGDSWEIFKVWGAEAKGITRDDVYEAYPNSYDATTKTFGFYLVYFDMMGFTYTTLDQDDFILTTFQITGDAPATQSSAVQASAEVKAVKTISRVNGCKISSVNQLYKTADVKVSKYPTKEKKSNDSNKQTPVKRSANRVDSMTPRF